MKRYLPFILLILILLLAAYLRLYRIADYMTFLGDEGRDVLVAKEILQGNFTLLGPRSSAGDFFMGPAYYYMITPFLWLFRYDPVGPAVMVAILSVVTTWLIFFVGTKWFNKKAGLFAASLYAVSPIVITYSHSSWNPDVLPFFSLLAIYLLFKANTENKGIKYFVGVGILLGISLQLHYLALFLIATVFLYTLLTKKHVVKRYAGMIVGFIIGFSPFLAFEVRHSFLNTKTIFSFIFSDTLQQKGYETGGTFLSTIADVFFRIFAKLVFYFPSIDKYNLFSPLQLDLFSWFVMLVSIAAIVGLWFIKNKQALILIALWLFLGVFLFGFYKKQIYDYHFTFLFPLPFLIIGNFFSQLLTLGKNNKQKIAAIGLSMGLFIGIFAYNLNGMPFRYIPNRQKEQVKLIANSVIQHADNKPYNFALISKGNSDHAYRYFLETLGHPPVTLENTLIDPDRKSATDQLLIVCEDLECEPLGYSLFEVAGFGRAEIVEEWNISVVKAYRLVHYSEK
jgi:4-amino-4-deoxy-L-arabinose transferase-like glycosyltransferase